MVNEFSYTNYDKFGRPLESGVAQGNFHTLDGQNSSVTGNKEQHFTAYDYLSDDHKTILENMLHTDYHNPSFLASNVATTWNTDQNGTQQSQIFYSYDLYGRVQWMVQNLEGLGVKTIDYEYDPVTSQVLKVIYQKHNLAELFVHKYSYNTTQELVQVQTSTDNVNFTTHADYNYYETGALKRVELAEGIQGIDYVYNLAGQLKAINHPNLTSEDDPGQDPNDLFGMTLDYHTGDYHRNSNFSLLNSGTDQYNGNIKGMTWKTQFGNTENPFQYTYQYNRNNWLTEASFNGNSNQQGPAADLVLDGIITSSQNVEATNSITLLPGFEVVSGVEFTASIQENSGGDFGTTDYKVFGITYDANGNIQTLNRNKNTENSSNRMDELSYQYKTDKPNQLKRVDDAVTIETNANDIKDQTTENNYIYNSIGQLVENIDESIKYQYNASGLVTKVLKDNQVLVKFMYNDKGFRLKKESYSSGSLSKTTYYVRDASGNPLSIIDVPSGSKPTNSEELPIYGASRLGIYNRASNTSVYQLTDHLGNVRAVIAKDGAGNAAALVHATDYYPFGMPMPNRQIVGGEPYRYAYQGQEKDPETGKEAFQLRLWDSRIGRWLSPDPAKQYYSPYLGMGNNPILMIDPDGGFACPDGDCETADGGTLDEVVIKAKVTPHHTSEVDPYTPVYTLAEYRKTFNVPDDIPDNEVYAWWQKNHGKNYSGPGQDFESWVAKMEQRQKDEENLYKLTMFLGGMVSLGEVMSPGASKLAAVRSFNFKGIYTTSKLTNIKIHGNSLKSPKKTWFYKLYSQDGTFLKNGITSKLIPETRYTKAFMADKYMDDLVRFPNRLKAYSFEHEMNKILRGPLNLNMH